MVSSREDYRALENLLEYEFTNIALLKQALTHKSFARLANEQDNERLEFLGDAVLQLIVSNHLYTSYPTMSEGELAKIRALLVSQPTLAKVARELRLSDYLRVGKGEERTGARNRDSLLSDTLEAVFGAIYLDSSLHRVEPIILSNLPSWDRQQLSLVDAKTTLQEHFQQTTQATPVYHLAEEHGPDHDKLFVVDVLFQDEILGRGKGRTKKEAAQAAAREALANLDITL